MQVDNFSIDITTKLLRATFLNNMEAFKNILPEVYKYFLGHKSGETLLTIDEKNNVNLVDNGQLVYDGDPKELALEQLDIFVNDPKCFSYGTVFSESPVFEHEKILKKLSLRQKSDTSQFSNVQIEIPFNEPQIDFFCMIGCGLGYQIEALFERKDIKYFYLYEASKDVFFAAMHCIDFKPLIDKCKSLGGSFTISVGGNEFSFVNEINNLLKVNGFFLVSRIFAYRHYMSEENTKAFELIHKVAHRYSAGWGFFEDEIISLIHTVENTEHSFPLLKRNCSIEKEYLKSFPVVIVGNGPSLDKDIELLKSRQNDVIIISCGTALKSLLNNGITPNLQVEMERTAQLDDHYNLFTDEEHKILKTIPIIALNTVYTGLLNRFEKAYNMLKINDAGTDFVNFLTPGNNYQVVKFCNPTVSNTALIAMLHLGFDNIYLLGVDLGFVDNEHHHSKSSMYYKGEWDGKEAQHKRFKGSSMATPGNFRDEVFTTQIFDSSKAMMEFSVKDFPKANVYNCSDGAKIRGVAPLAFNSIELKTLDKLDFDKNTDFVELLDDSFVAFEKDKQYVHNFVEFEFLPKFRTVIDTFNEYLDEPIDSRASLSDMFERQNSYIYLLSTRTNTQLYFRFMKGSMIYFQSSIMTNCAKYTDEEMKKSFIKDALLEMKHHFEFLYAELVHGYKKPAKL